MSDVLLRAVLHIFLDHKGNMTPKVVSMHQKAQNEANLILIQQWLAGCLPPTVDVPNSVAIKVGDQVGLAIDPGEIRLLPEDSA
jgi:hypothetical protein